MIRTATAGDIGPIMEIVRDTVAIFKAENNPQRDDDYPGERDFLEDARTNSLYAFEREGDVLGVVCVNDVEPVEWRRTDKAMEIHRIAVSPRARRQGVAQALLDFADRLAVEKSFAYVKTDTFSRNQRMNPLFIKNGFFMVGKINLKDIPGYFYCYDKIL